MWQCLREKPIELISLVPEEEHTIKQLSETIADLYSIQDKLTFDTTFADGQHRKTMGNDILR